MCNSCGACSRSVFQLFHPKPLSPVSVTTLVAVHVDLPCRPAWPGVQVMLAGLGHSSRSMPGPSFASPCFWVQFYGSIIPFLNICLRIMEWSVQPGVGTGSRSSILFGTKKKGEAPVTSSPSKQKETVSITEGVFMKIQTLKKTKASQESALARIGVDLSRNVFHIPLGLHLLSRSIPSPGWSFHQETGGMRCSFLLKG